MHIWIEGVPQSVLDGLSRHLLVSAATLDLGTFERSNRSAGKHESLQ